MTDRANKRPEVFAKPAYWSDTPPPEASEAKGEGNDDEELSPTRYGDWVRNGIAIDF